VISKGGQKTKEKGDVERGHGIERGGRGFVETTTQRINTPSYRGKKKGTLPFDQIEGRKRVGRM